MFASQTSKPEPFERRLRHFVGRYEAVAPSATCKVSTKNSGALCYERVLSSCGDERERETERGRLMKVLELKYSDIS